MDVCVCRERESEEEAWGLGWSVAGKVGCVVKGNSKMDCWVMLLF